MEADIDAAGEQLRIFQDQYKEKSKEYDRLFEELNLTSQVHDLNPFHHVNLYFFLFRALSFKDLKTNGLFSLLPRNCRASELPLRLSAKSFGSLRRNVKPKSATARNTLTCSSH